MSKGVDSLNNIDDQMRFFDTNLNRQDLLVLSQKGLIDINHVDLIIENKTPKEVRKIIGTIQHSAENIVILNNEEQFRSDFDDIVNNKSIISLETIAMEAGTKRWEG